MLPPMFIIWANSNRYCIFQTSIAQHSDPLIWKFDILENPKYILQNAMYMNDYVVGRQQTILHQRITRTGEIKQYQVVMKRQSNYFQTNGMGFIPFYKMTRKIPGLSSKFAKVVNGEDTQQKYHFILNDQGRVAGLPSGTTAGVSGSMGAAAKSTIITTIPPHILRAYVESEIAKASMCPISLEPFTTESKVAVPPCGHLFLQSALKQQIESGDCLCAVCRTPFAPSQLFSYPQ